MVLPWNPLLVYARWRESYLIAHPEKRLFPWLEGGLRQVSETWEEAVEEAGPVIKLGARGEQIKNKGIMAIVAIAIMLVLASDS